MYSQSIIIMTQTMYMHMHLMSLNGQMEFEFDLCTCTYIAIGRVTGVRLTCEPVGLINWCCNVTWQVSNSLLYVHMYIYLLLYMHTQNCIVNLYTYIRT